MRKFWWNVPCFFLFVFVVAHQVMGTEIRSASASGHLALEVLQNDLYIDPSLTDFESPTYIPQEGVFHLFSHGKPGHLLLEGQWRDIKEIKEWFGENGYLQGFEHLNIYGCEFAKGLGGKMAVDYLVEELNITIAASNDTTGIDGDWELEVGTPRNVIQVNDYQGNLQNATLDDNFSGVNGYYSWSDFSYNGTVYEGFCIEFYDDVPYVGDSFATSTSSSTLSSADAADVAAILDAMDDTSLGNKQARYTYIAYAIWSITDNLNPASTHYETEINLILSRVNDGTYTAPPTVYFGNNQNRSSRQNMVFSPPSDDDDDDDDPCLGSADDVESSYYVNNANNATGSPDNSTATLSYSSSYLILDLDETLSAGTPYSIWWRTSYHNISATVEESSNGSSWTAASGSPFSVNSSSIAAQQITTGTSTRYLRIKRSGHSSLKVDAVTFSDGPSITAYVRGTGSSWTQGANLSVCLGDPIDLGTQTGIQSNVVLTDPNGLTDNSPDGNTYFRPANSAGNSHAGTYTITYTDDDGCSVEQDYTVTVNSLSLTPEYSVDDGAWVSGNSLTLYGGRRLELDIDGGTFSSNTWTGPNGFNQSGNSSGQILISNSIDVAEAGIYTVTATDTDGCVQTQQFNVSVSPPLPLEWLGFEVRQTRQDAQLEWITTNESNVSHFQVERSFTGQIFEQIGSIVEATNSSGNNNYSFLDKQVASQHTGNVYYRVKQLDMNGQFSYSKMVRLSLGNEVAVDLQVKIHPNPAKDFVTFEYSQVIPTDIPYEVLSISGQRTYQGTAKEKDAELLLDVRSWKNGVYFMQFNADKKLVVRFVVRH